MHPEALLEIKQELLQNTSTQKKSGFLEVIIQLHLQVQVLLQNLHHSHHQQQQAQEVDNET